MPVGRQRGAARKPAAALGRRDDRRDLRHPAVALAPKVVATVAVLVAAAGGTAAVHETSTPSARPPAIERPAPAASALPVPIAATGERDVKPPPATTTTTASSTPTTAGRSTAKRRAKPARSRRAAAKAKGRKRSSPARAHNAQRRRARALRDLEPAGDGRQARGQAGPLCREAAGSAQGRQDPRREAEDAQGRHEPRRQDPTRTLAQALSRPPASVEL